MRILDLRTRTGSLHSGQRKGPSAFETSRASTDSRSDFRSAEIMGFWKPYFTTPSDHREASPDNPPALGVVVSENPQRCWGLHWNIGTAGRGRWKHPGRPLAPGWSRSVCLSPRRVDEHGDGSGLANYWVRTTIVEQCRDPLRTEITTT